MAVEITSRQMKRVQTLWGLFWKHVAGSDNLQFHVRPAMNRATERSARLAWIGGAIGRQIESCKDLSKDEADKAITELQKHLPEELAKAAGNGWTARVHAAPSSRSQRMRMVSRRPPAFHETMRMRWE